MAGNAFTNLDKIYLSDTFRVWFDKTNQIIDTINPIGIYGVTAMEGENAGITISIGSDGIASVGISFPTSITGSLSFSDGVTFTDRVSISGLTLDLTPNGGPGATMYGRVVRSINGATGDITLSTVSIPGSPTDGDILYYETTGSTFHTYNLFSDGTAENETFHIGSAGGIFVGVTSGGASAAAFVVGGNIQLSGHTGAGIYLSNISNNLSSSLTGGVDIRYSTSSGANIFSIGGRNVSGQTYSSYNLSIDCSTQRTTIGGVTSDASLNIHDKASGKMLQFIDNDGSTFTFRRLDAGSDGGRVSGGFTGLSAFSSNPATKGLKEDNRLRLENITDSLEFEITGSGKTSGVAIYGVNSSGPYGDILTPTLVARRDGNVVIGGIAPNDGGLTGSTHGGLNIVSGKIYVGGTLGSQNSKNIQVLSSNGISAGWTILESTAFNYTGTITSVANRSVGPGSPPSLDLLEDPTKTIKFTSENSLVEQTGPFNIMVSFPTVKLKGVPNSTEDAVIGVMIDIDGTKSEMESTIYFKELYESGIQFITPVFVASGEATKYVRLTPFMTQGEFTDSQNSERFQYVTRGTYSATFNKLG